MARTIMKAISIAFLSSTLISGCLSNPMSSKDQALSKLAQAQTETQDGDVSIAWTVYHRGTQNCPSQIRPLDYVLPGTGRLNLIGGES